MGKNYQIVCYNCKASFNAMDADWCNCITSDRSLVCPACKKCFCAAPKPYSDGFWNNAPDEMWERKAAEHAVDRRPQSNPDPAEVKRPLILLLDDDPDIQRIATIAIMKLGYSMIVASDGVKGLELVKSYRPELVLADALMPLMDGREMCLKIKQDPELSSTKVVIMTALYKQSRHKSEAFRQYRVDEYLTKPFEFSVLADTLKKFLG